MRDTEADLIVGSNMKSELVNLLLQVSAPELISRGHRLYPSGHQANRAIRFPGGSITSTQTLDVRHQVERDAKRNGTVG